MITITLVLSDFWPLAEMSRFAFVGSAFLGAVELVVEMTLLALVLS